MVRDDPPFGDTEPPAASYVYSPDRSHVHPEAFLRSWSDVMQADAYAGFGILYETERSPGMIVEAECWAHWRRKFYEIATLKKAPIAVEAVKRFDAIFAIERTINGAVLSKRQAVRHQTTSSLVDDLVLWMRKQRGTLSSKTEVVKAMDLRCVPCRLALGQSRRKLAEGRDRHHYPWGPRDASANGGRQEGLSHPDRIDERRARTKADLPPTLPISRSKSSRAGAPWGGTQDSRLRRCAGDPSAKYAARVVDIMVANGSMSA